MDNLYLENIGIRAKEAAKQLSVASSEMKNAALSAVADALEENARQIIAANKTDLENGKNAGLAESMLDRLMLDEERISKIAAAIREIIALDDPVGKTISGTTRPNGMKISKVSVPFSPHSHDLKYNALLSHVAFCLR